MSIIFQVPISGGFAFQIDDVGNLVKGDIAVPTSIVAGLILKGGTVPSGDPIGNGAALVCSNVGLTMRTGVANEGAGENANLFHRHLEQVAVGTPHTFTTMVEQVSFGMDSPELTLPTAGRWLITARVAIDYVACTTAGQIILLKMRNVTDTADLLNTTLLIALGDHTTITQTHGHVEWSGIFEATAALKNIQIFGQISGTPSAGSMQCFSSLMRAVRLA